MAQLPSPFISHSQKVCRLYKRALRTLEDYNHHRLWLRYEAVLLRQRFEENRNVRDPRIAKQLLVDGEEELFQKQHWQPFKFGSSVGGYAYQREVYVPDYVVDFWDPVEKAKYPKYFAKREQMKKEYEELYYKLHPETPETSENKK